MLELRAMVLGDGHLKRTKSGAWLRLCHSHNQLSYLEAKARLLQEYPRGRTESYQKGESVFHQIRWHSQPEWGTIYDEMYVGGRKQVHSRFLEKLTPLGWAIWFADDGTRRRDTRAGFGANDLAEFYVSVRSTNDESGIQRVLSQFGTVSLKAVCGIWIFRLSSTASERLGVMINDPLVSLGMECKVIEQHSRRRLSQR